MSSSHPSFNILITGANRGIGLALVKAYSLSLSSANNNDKKPNIIFAGVRDPSNSSSISELIEFSKSDECKAEIHVIKIESGNEEGNKVAFEAVKKVVGHLDMIIANAGVADGMSPLLKTPIPSFLSHFQTNTLGPLILLQSFHPLLNSSPLEHPKFIIISALGGSLAMTPKFGTSLPLGGYGLSKVGVNYLAVKLAAEERERGLIVIPIHPGLVSTDMGSAVLLNLGLEPGQALPGMTILTPTESAEAIKKVIDGAKMENSGKFMSYDGEVLPW